MLGGIIHIWLYSVLCVMTSQAFAQAPALKINSPQDYQVSQRDDAGIGLVPVQVAADPSVRELQITVRNAAGTTVAETTVPTAVGPVTSTAVKVPAGGWYSLKVQALAELQAGDGEDHGKVLAEAEVAHLGVGEVFLTAGQSNSVAAGEKPQPNVDLVSAGTLNAAGQMMWSHTIDSGPTGTPWPVLANALVNRLNIPVAIIQVGCGGTEIAQWLPAGDADLKPADLCGDDTKVPGNLFLRLVKASQALVSYRALLWHQGESDTMFKTPRLTYVRRFSTVINTLGSRVQMKPKWMVANVSFVPGTEANKADCSATGKPLSWAAAMLEVRAGQQEIWKTLALRGPDTDGLSGKPYRYPGAMGNCIHFSDDGLKMHGQFWFRSLSEAGLIPGISASRAVVQAPLYKFHSQGWDYLYAGSKNAIQGYVTDGFAFSVEAQAAGNNSVLNECEFNGGAHFLSSDAHCESFKVIGPLGFVSSDPSLIATRPLYRVVKGWRSFFSTTSMDEVLAGAQQGYAYQGITGFALDPSVLKPMQMANGK